MFISVSSLNWKICPYAKKKKSWTKWFAIRSHKNIKISSHYQEFYFMLFLNFFVWFKTSWKTTQWCFVSPVSCWHVSRLWRHSVRLSEWTAKPSPFSMQGSLWEFSRSMAVNTEKSVSLTDSDVQTFRKGKEKPKVTYSVALITAFLAAEIWLICHRLMWPFTKKISSVGKDEIDEWEFCKLKITPIIVFVIMTQRIFPSWALEPTHCAIFIGELSISLSSFINEVGFFRQ